MDARITPNADGTFTVGYLTVMTQEQAGALLVETGVFNAAAWPFTDRRKFHRHVVSNNEGAAPSTYFVESET